MLKFYHKSTFGGLMLKVFKFQKSKYPIIPVAFFCVIVFSLFTILMIFKNNYTKFEIRNFISPIEPITMNIEMKDKINSNVFVCYDDYCSVLDNSILSNIYYSHFQSGYENTDNKKIKNIILAYPADDKKFFNELLNIDLHIGNKKYYLNKDELSKINQKKFKIEVSNSNSKKQEIVEYNTLLLSDKGNYRGIFNNICILFLSLFYNWQMFIIPYAWLFFAFVFYLFNRNEFNFNFKFLKIKPIYILSFVCLVGVLLRLDNISYYPLWTDEVYTKTVAIKDFVSCFKDAGNPPLFFILEYLITKLIGTSDTALRFLPFVFGISTIPLVYLLFKEINTKTALFASFMASINTIFIYHSTEARGYSLSCLLVVLNIYFLFKYLKNNSLKNLVLYAIVMILSINHNYYLSLFVFCNFIWGVVDLFQNKNKKNILSFVIANFVSIVTILPYLFISFKVAISSSFNSWIPKFGFELYKYAINEYFLNKYIFLFLCIVVFVNLVLIYLPKNILEKMNLKLNPKKSEFLIYLVFCLALILILASIVSVYIKPIFHKRVLLSIYMLLFLIEVINITGIVEFVKNNKYTKILKTSYFLILAFVYFSITKPMPIIMQCRLDDFMNLVQNDAIKYEKEYEIHCITCDTEEYLEHYPEVKKLNIKWHYIDTNSGFHIEKLNKFDYIDKNKKSIIYMHAISTDISQIALFNPYIDIFKSNSISSARLIYKPKNKGEK